MEPITCPHPTCGHTWTPRKAAVKTCAKCGRYLSEEDGRAVTRARYERNRSEIIAKNCSYVKSMSPERRARYEAYQRDYKKNLSPEQRKRRSDYSRKRRKSLPEDKKQLERERWMRWKTTWTDRHRQARSHSSMKWFAARPGYLKSRNQRRRARIRGGGGSYTPQEWRELVDRFDHHCLCCGRREPEIRLTVDHVVPVSLGGSSSIENIQPLCLSCNIRKRDKIVDYREARVA